ncbi:MAG: hypothetical protein HC825_02485 [Oscillatoriales cyanobacterium RM1_1_9]|nr:hypothetical protein [Oscillatoriales cyanobacterium SM2_3_0]NJO45957.1 hypothetical protein [Oscillatoriales cyanobacterium RM2_1_1]NJO70863.1 hypothetical protein [Oscillatoriales cyanobacterium RM1_1_9]
MDFREYQHDATHQEIATIKFYKLCAIGLEQEARDINAQAKKLQSLEDIYLNKFKQHLADCLWFLTNIAHAVDLDLDSIVAENLSIRGQEEAIRIPEFESSTLGLDNQPVQES